MIEVFGGLRLGIADESAPTMDSLLVQGAALAAIISDIVKTKFPIGKYLFDNDTTGPIIPDR